MVRATIHRKFGTHTAVLCSMSQVMCHIVVPNGMLVSMRVDYLRDHR
jgi:hypothetical protein